MHRKASHIVLIVAAIFLVVSRSLGQQAYFDSLRISLLKNHSNDSAAFYYDKWLPIGIQVNHDSTQADLEKLKQLYQSTKDEFTNAVYLIQHAYWYTEKTGDYQKALHQAIEAKQIFEKLDSKPQLANALWRIAFFKLWNEIGLQKKALDESILNDYLLPAQKIAESTNDNNLKIRIYQGIGSYYNVSRREHNNALVYFLKAEQLCKEQTDPILKLTNLASIGIVYSDMCDKENMLLYLEKYENSEFSKNYLYGLGNLYRAIANYYLHCETNTEQALYYAQKAYGLAQQMKAPEYSNLSQRRLYEVYKRMGNTEMALYYLELHKETEATLARNKFEFAYTEYDVQNKEQMILKQKYRIQQKNTLITITLGSLLILGVLSFVIFKIKKKNQLLELKELEKQKQVQLDIAVRATEEEERRRISANLHDSVVQKLVVAKMNLETIQNNAGSNKEIINNIHGLVEESTSEIRQLSHTLMPASFEQEGLGKIVIEFAHKIINKQIKIDVFEEGDFLSLPKNVAIIAYRIVQECVQNALKHANPKTISISLIADKQLLEISVEDDGKGFDIENSKKSGIGLHSMKERVNQLNGQFHIESRQGSGCIVLIKLPYTA